MFSNKQKTVPTDTVLEDILIFYLLIEFRFVKKSVYKFKPLSFSNKKSEAIIRIMNSNATK